MGLEASTAVLKYLLVLAGAAALFLHLIKQRTLHLGEPDEFVVVLTSYAGFESRVAAGRASRQVLPATFPP